MPSRKMYIGGSVLYTAALAFVGAGLAVYAAFATSSIPGNFGIFIIMAMAMFTAGCLLVMYSRRTGYV